MNTWRAIRIFIYLYIMYFILGVLYFIFIYAKHPLTEAKSIVACKEHYGPRSLNIAFSNDTICKDGLIVNLDSIYGQEVYDLIKEVENYNSRYRLNLATVGIYGLNVPDTNIIIK